MRNSFFVRCGVTTFFLNAALWGSSPIVQAQIITDGTMGPAGALAGPNYQIPAELGRKLGPNLFHSFLDFQLGSGESATFSGPASVRNILSRVTGGATSLIDGNINSTIGGANLFFLNPAGVVFGPNAQINVGGSFVVSSADVAKLGQNGSFNALDPSATVLTSAPPQAFGFLTPNPQPILFYGSQLGTAPGRSFSIIGGGVGVYDGSVLQSTGGLNVVSVGSAGEISLDVENPLKPIIGKDLTALGPIEVTGQSALAANGGGKLTVRGQDLTVDNSDLFARNDGSTPGIPSGIDLGLTGDLTVDAAGGIQSLVRDAPSGPTIVIEADRIFLGTESKIVSATQGTGQGGAINVKATRIELSDGAEISSTTQGSGQGGAINLEVQDLVALGEGAPAGIFAVTQSGGTGGALTISAQNIRLVKASISTNTLASGQGSALNIVADSIYIDGGETRRAAISSDSQTNGRGGVITIDARDLQVKSGATISASALGTGAGGSLDIKADTIRLDGNALSTGIQAVTGDQGAGGKIRVRAGNLQILGNAAINASSFGPGASGNISIIADQIVLDGRNLVRDPGDLLANSGIVSESRTANAGRGGNITIETKDLQMRRGANISTFTASASAGGNIVLNAGKIDVDGRENRTGIVAGTSDRGQSGGVTVSADSLLLQGAGILSSSTLGEGNGGNVTVGARDIVLAGGNTAEPTGITSVAQAGSTGNGGNITISADSLKITGSIGIDSSTESVGKSGNLTISAKQILLDDLGTGITRISAFSGSNQGGDSGTIRITADDLQVKGAAKIISSSTGSGQGGTISIDAKNLLVDAQSTTGISNIFTDTTGTGGDATGGNISIHADTLKILNGSFVSSSTGGAGNGGNIEITALDTRIENGSAVSAQTFGAGLGGNIDVDSKSLVIDGGPRSAGFNAETHYAGPNTDGDKGRGGTISIKADSLAMVNNAVMSTSSLGQNGQTATGNAGKIKIDVGNMVLENSVIASLSSGSGNGGTIELNASSSVALNQGGISTEATQKDAGDIFITVGNTLGLQNNSLIATAANNDGGNIDIRVGRSFRSKQSELSARAENDGGNVTIDSLLGQSISRDILLDRANIRANAVNGSGGKILLRSRVFLPSAESVVSASSTFGTNGTVNIESPNTNVGGSLITLPSNLLDAENYLAERCVVRTTGASSSFTVEAQNGTPPQPGDLLPSPAGR